MIFTSVCFLGDHLLLWPVASWYYKKYNEKIHWVLSKNFYLYPKIYDMLMAQPFTEAVSYVDVGTDAWNMNHWKFNPSRHGIAGEYLNFGFWGMPTKYLSEYYADRYGLDYDREFVPTLIDVDCPTVNTVTIDITDPHRPGYAEMRASRPSDVVQLNFNDSYEKNIMMGFKANRRILSTSSYAIFMDMLNKPCEIYGSVEFHREWFYRNDTHLIRLFNR